MNTHGSVLPYSLFNLTCSNYVAKALQHEKASECRNNKGQIAAVLVVTEPIDRCSWKRPESPL